MIHIEIDIASKTPKEDKNEEDDFSEADEKWQQEETTVNLTSRRVRARPTKQRAPTKKDDKLVYGLEYA